jgi:RHS repeat-associated protein
MKTSMRAWVSLFSRYFLCLFMVLPVSRALAAGDAGCRYSYGATNAFGSGLLVNLNYTNAEAELRLNTQTRPFKFLNVPCGESGTLVRIDVTTSNVVGEYRTAPLGKASFPSHTVVDRYGNAWVANWDERGCLDGTTNGSIARIGVVIGGTRGDIQTNALGVVTNFVANTNGGYLKPPFDYCTAVDRNGDGYIRTSKGLNDVLGWPTNGVGGVAGSVANAQDECIINYVRVPAQFVSGLALDENNDLWVGGYCDYYTPDHPETNACGNRVHVKVDGVTGQVLTNRVTLTTNGVAYGGFEGLVAAYGWLWSSGGANNCSNCPSGPGNHSLAIYNPASGAFAIATNSAADFGMAIDPQTGNIWVSSYEGSHVGVFSPWGQWSTNYYHGDTYGGGLAIDNVGNVWVAHGPWLGGTTVGHLRTDGTLVSNIVLSTSDCLSASPASTVAIDANGKVWAVCAKGDSGTAPKLFRIDPATEQVDLCLTLTGHTNREPYGDLTGQRLLAGTAPSGVWSLVCTNGATNQAWYGVSWTASADSDQVLVEVRAANQAGWLSTNLYQRVQNGAAATNLVGKYLEIRVTLLLGSGTNSPGLHDLSLICQGQAPWIVTQPTNQFVCPGLNVAFSVTAAGEAQLSYQWRYNAASLAGKTSTSLTLTNVQATNTGSYSVVVSNAYGVVTSEVATLTLLTNVGISVSPLSTNVCPGANATFNVVGGGSGLNYQWYRNDSLLVGRTGSTLVVTNIQATNAGTYCVAVSGTCNALTNCAILTLNEPVTITTLPTNVVARPGTNATFMVAATGSGLSYQWWRGTNVLTGRTNSTLVLTNVAATDADVYCVSVNGSCGSTNLCAILSVECLPSPAGLVAWWQGENNGWEVVFANNATLCGGNLGQAARMALLTTDSVISNAAYADSLLRALSPRGGQTTSRSIDGVSRALTLDASFAGQGFDPGEVGTAFHFNGWDSLAYAYVPAASNLDVGQNNGFTLECWINPDDLYSGGPLFTWHDEWGEPIVTLWANWYAAGDLVADLYDSEWNGTTLVSDPYVLTAGTFQHVALTYSRSSGTVTLYLNGVQLAGCPIDNIVPCTAGDLYLGGSPSWDVYYFGLLDEPAIYNRVLNTAEIRAIYDAGSIGRCGIAPSFVLQPASQSVVAGNDVQLLAKAAGTSLSYQWLFNSNAIAGADATSLTITNVQLTNAGTYAVRVTNSLGVITSSNALLTVTTPVCLQAPAGLVGWWRAQSNALDSISGSYAILTNGAGFAQGKVGSAFNLNGSSEYVAVPDNASFNPTAAITVEAWIYPRSIDNTPAPAVIKKSGGAGSSGQENGYALEVNGTGIRFWVFRNPGQWTPSALASIPVNRWSHVAGVYDGTNLCFYFNGKPVGSPVYAPGAIVPSSRALHIGHDPSNPRFFDGLIDEASIYTTALSATQIQGAYNASYLGKCQEPPAITLQPVSQAVGLGSNATFTVSATGTPQLRYQWRFNGTDVTGATFTSLTLANVQTSQAGSYTVLVTNSFGSILSSNALLAITNATPKVYFVSPTNNQMFPIAPTNILQAAVATNVDGSVITNVQFFTNTVWLGTGTTSSNQAQFLWQNASPGTYSVTAWATNTYGASAGATVTNVVLNAMPLISIVSPTNSTSTNLTSFFGPTNLVLRAVASDPDGTNVIVQFFHRTNAGSGFVWTNLIGTITKTDTTNFFLTWTNCPVDTHAVFAVATDTNGAASASQLLVFEVRPANPPPSVWIIWPTNGATFPAGANITIVAEATNFTLPSALVTNVAFFADTNLLGVDPDRPYSVTECCWKPGTYLLRARASDNLGASATSAAVEITVIEPMPTAGDGYWDPVLPEQFYQVCCRGHDSLSGNYYIGAMVADGTNLYFGLNYARSPWDVIVKFDGRQISIIGDLGDLCFTINAIAQLDGCIYVAGSRNDTSDDTPVYRWDGTNWTCMGGSIVGDIYALSVVGSDLYIGGNFRPAEGADTNLYHFAKWNRTIGAAGDWEPVAVALNGSVRAIASMAGKIFVGGDFTGTGENTNLSHIAQLNGNSWINLGQGVCGTNFASSEDIYGYPCAVHCLTPCGDRLFVGGDFTIAGEQAQANGIAIWDGHDWGTIGQGLEESRYWWGLYVDGDLGVLYPGKAVYSMTARGNDLFLAGVFRGPRLDGSDCLPSRGVVKATWSEQSQEWSWSGLDQGLLPILADYWEGAGLTTAIIEGADPTSYSFFVGGEFVYAGSTEPYRFPNWNFNHCDDLRGYHIGRWNVGQPKPLGSPIVVITNPPPNTVITNPTQITLAARASSYTNIAHVSFFTNGVFFAEAENPSADVYVKEWLDTPVGMHLLTASAVAADGLIGVSATSVLITVRATNNPCSATADFYCVREGGDQASLFVLTNDLPANGSLRISRVTQLNGNYGRAAVSSDRAYLTYTPLPHTHGTDRFFYTITNSSGASDSAWVTVAIQAKPLMVITWPSDGDRFSTNVNIGFTCTARDYDGVITNLSLYLDTTTLLGQTTNSTLTSNWSNSTAGFYTFVAVAADNDGLTTSSLPVTIVLTNATASPHAPIATISNLTDAVTTQGSFTSIVHPVIRDGLFDLEGAALDPDGDPVAYAILLFRPDDLDFGISGEIKEALEAAEPYANLTPGTLNPQGFHNGAVTNGSLGVLDFTRFPNGSYYLILRVRGGTDETNAVVLFQLDNQLKVGQFSFTEQDLVIPVNGIPLTVTRTYSSLNPRSADFGWGWTYNLLGMDVQLDDERQEVTIGSNQAPFADDEEDDNGLPKQVSIRTGGGWDVTLTLPDGRRTTFAFTPDVHVGFAKANWTAPSEAHATLTSLDAYPDITLIPYLPPYWDAGGDHSTLDNHDISGWVLTNWDGTAYYITRGAGNNVIYYPEGSFSPVSAQTYGPPKLTSIVQRSGDRIDITDSGIEHHNPTNGLTRSIFFERDSAGRITTLWDPIGHGSSAIGYPSVKYVYHRDTGNLLQVHRLTDRAAGTYVVTKYHYDNPNFPHYITSIENPLGIPILRNEYNDAGQLIATVDANGNRTEVHHNINGRTEIVIDALNRTNILAYDLRGNVTATTNALGGVTLREFDENNNKTNEVVYQNGVPYATNQAVFSAEGFLRASIDPLGNSNTFAVNGYGQVLTSTDARHYTSTNYYDEGTGNLLASRDALGNVSSNYWDASGLPVGSRDPLGNRTTNYFDDAGNLVASAALDAAGVILSTNTAAFDANGNQTNLVVWSRRGGSGWVGATNSYILDAQGRRTATIAPDGGISRSVLNELGQAVQTIDASNRVTFHDFDWLGREYKTTYPDGRYELTLFDAVGNAYARVDRAERTSYTLFDALNRSVGTVFADSTTNRTVLDDLGRVKFSIDATGVTNAPGYNAVGQRTSQTNAFGTAQQTVYRFGFDENGNEIWSLQPGGTGITNVFDALNRQVEMRFADGTKKFTGYNAAGQRVAETNQDSIITLFGIDGAGRLACVTNAFGTNQVVTRYLNDEAGNQVAQIDANNQTNRFETDNMGRRTKHTLPGGQTESWGFDLVGNEIRHTNFNAVVITNEFDLMNRCTNRTSVGYFASFAFSPTGHRTNMVDQSGSTVYKYNARDWLTNKVVSWSGGPAVSLSYALDPNGNVTNLWSDTPNGVNLAYALDSLSRITNVVANSSQAASYRFDVNGNLRTLHYGNGVTNLYRYDPLNRLTNLVWRLNTTLLSRFSYQLGATGNRTNLSETVNGVSRSYAWEYDPLYRLRQESIPDLGTVTYGLDPVGNRTNRQSTIGNLPSTISAYNSNDWLTNDAYDSNGNTLWSTNGATATGPYYYDIENRLTNFNNSVFLTYNGDGSRVRKTANGTNFFYLVDDRNPSGYAQVLEEWTAGGGVTNLSRVYNWGLALISQREASGTVYFFVPDGHGSTRLLTDNGGAVVNAFTYDAYGNLIASNGPPQTTHLSCGEDFDLHLGMYYQRARYYQSGTGRFWTADPAQGDKQDPLSLHKYLYCQGNPVNCFDPSGLETVFVVRDGGGIGSGGAAKSAASHLEKAGWTVRYMTSDDFGQITGGGPNDHFDGIIMAGHGDATESGGVQRTMLENILGRNHDKLKVLMALSCHGNEYVAPLIQKNYTASDALIVSYRGYNYNDGPTNYRIGCAIDKWVQRRTYTEVIEGKVIVDGFGIAGHEVLADVGFFVTVLTGGWLGW